MENPQTGGKCNVYVWFDRKVPFYVGLGGTKRLKSRHRNKWASNRRKESESRNDFVQEVVFSGSRRACEDVETFLISSWGSVVNGGILFNFTEGGDGGDTFTNASEEEKARRRQLSQIRGKLATKDKDPDGKSSQARAKCKILHSQKDDQGKSLVAKKAGIASALARQDLKDEWGRNLVSMSSWMAKKQKPIKVTSLVTGEEFIFPSAQTAAKILGLSQPSLSRVARGERKRHKNYTAEYLDHGN
jgi:hypothetical protein